MPHTHVYIHVLTTDWRGRPAIRARCACGDKLTAKEIRYLRAQAGLLA